MIVTKNNYKTLKDQVVGIDINTMDHSQLITAECYLSHRLRYEERGNEEAQAWTRAQLRMIAQRKYELTGTVVLRG